MRRGYVHVVFFSLAEISLPPIESLIKPSSYVCYENHGYDMQSNMSPAMIAASPQPMPPTPQSIVAEPCYDDKSNDIYYMNQMMDIDMQQHVMAAPGIQASPMAHNMINGDGSGGNSSTAGYIKEPATPYMTDVEEDLVDGMADLVSANSSFNSSSGSEKVYSLTQITFKANG